MNEFRKNFNMTCARRVWHWQQLRRNRRKSCRRDWQLPLTENFQSAGIFLRVIEKLPREIIFF